MKINQLTESSTTSGSIAPGAQSMNAPMHKRMPNGSNLMKGIVSSAKFPNSVTETGAPEFMNNKISCSSCGEKFWGNGRKDGFSKCTEHEGYRVVSESKAVKEAEIKENDLVMSPGKGNKIKPGLLNKPEVKTNPTDTVKLDVPLLIRLLEYAREDAQTDADLHDLATKLVAGCTRGKTLSMKDYSKLVPETLSESENKPWVVYSNKQNIHRFKTYKQACAAQKKLGPNYKVASSEWIENNLTESMQLAPTTDTLSRSEWISRRKALQDLQMDPETAKNPMLKKLLFKKIAELRARAEASGLL